MRMKNLKFLFTALTASIFLTSCGPTNGGDSSNVSTSGQQIVEETFEEAQERLINEKIYDVKDLLNNVNEEIKLVLNESKNHFSEAATSAPDADRIEVILLATAQTFQDDRLSNSFIVDLNDKINDLINLYDAYPSMLRAAFYEFLTDIDNFFVDLEQSELLASIPQSDAISYYDLILVAEELARVKDIITMTVQELIEEYRANPEINIKERFKAILDAKLENEPGGIGKLINTVLDILARKFHEGSLDEVIKQLMESITKEEIADSFDPQLDRFVEANRKIYEIAKQLIPGIINDNPQYGVDQIRLLVRIMALEILEETDPNIINLFYYGLASSMAGKGAFTAHNYFAEYELATNNLNALIREELAKVGR